MLFGEKVAVTAARQGRSRGHCCYMWLPGRKMTCGEVMDMFNDLVEESRVMDSVWSDDGCSCGVEEGGRHVGDEVLRGRKDVAECRCWELRSSASRDLDALLATI